MKKFIIVVFILVLHILTFLWIDYYYILTKWSAIHYGKELLMDYYNYEKWSETVPLNAEKQNGVWKVYDEFIYPEGFLHSRYFATFVKRNEVIDVGME